MKLKRHQSTRRSVALYRWQITMRLASEIAALKKKRRRRLGTLNLEN